MFNILGEVDAEIVLFCSLLLTKLILKGKRHKHQFSSGTWRF